MSGNLGPEMPLNMLATEPNLRSYIHRSQAISFSLT